MAADLESRLESAAGSLPRPAGEAQARARAGALAALPKSRRRRSGRPRAYLAVAATALVAAVAALALVAPWEGSTPFDTERALAAIGDLPVVHALVQSERPWATIVNLETGEERPQLQRTEYWHDAERGLLRGAVFVDGRFLADFLQTREGWRTDAGPLVGPAREPRLDLALAGFATRYREALESGRARILGESEVDGRKVVVLEIRVESPGRSVYEEVEVDADTYRPVRFRFRLEGRPAHWWRVLSIGTIAREEGQFRPPQPGPPKPQSQTGTDERELTPAQAARALGRPALWPGRAVDGIELTKIEVMKLTTRWTDGREVEAEGLRFEYGGGIFDRAPRWLEVRQGTSREGAPRFGPFDPAVPRGRLQLYGFGDNDGSTVDHWLGSLQLEGMFVTLESSERDVLLAAARALRPIGAS